MTGVRYRGVTSWSTGGMWSSSTNSWIAMASGRVFREPSSSGARGSGDVIIWVNHLSDTKPNVTSREIAVVPVWSSNNQSPHSEEGRSLSEECPCHVLSAQDFVIGSCQKTASKARRG